MRRLSRPFLIALLLLLPLNAWSGDTAFVALEQINFANLLPPPPAVGSAVQKEETALLLTLQKERTPAMEAFAQADAERSVFRFADAVGADFTAEKLPRTAAFFVMVKENADALIGPAKRHWDRPRPYASTPEITPCVPKPGNASYPSGHSTFGTVDSIILANMLPEKAAQIYERAEAYRLNREIGGVHYPSDVAAGRIAGTVIVAFMQQSPAFQEAYGAARVELRQVLGLSQ
ncbi:MAG: acid phosphatase [Acidobacteriota bacterium]